MENSLLVTASLLDSVAWASKCPPSWRAKAKASLIATLKREKYTPHPSALRGIEFEDMIYAECMREVNESSIRALDPITSQVVKDCVGGEFQAKLKKHITVDGHDVVLYGKADVMFPQLIIDIKTTGVWRGPQKYLGGWQHILYPYISKVPEFEYLVVLFDGNHGVRPVAIRRVPIPALPERKQIDRGITHLFQYLKNEGLWEHYVNIYSKPKEKK